MLILYKITLVFFLAVIKRVIHHKLLVCVHENMVSSKAEYLKVLLVEQLLILPGECKHRAGGGYIKG